MPLPFSGDGTRTRSRTFRYQGKRQSVLNQGTDLYFYTPTLTNEQQFVGSYNFPHLDGRQVTVSEDHPLWKQRDTLPEFLDIGGNFYTRKQYVEGPLTGNYNASGSQTYFNGSTPWTRDYFRYRGALTPVDPSIVQFPDFVGSSLDDLDELGASAIAACKPTNSVADLSVALGEILSEGLPRLAGSSVWRDKTLTARNAGEEYLNLEFGWKPIARDIDDTMRAIVSYHEILAQYERDSGKMVRRRWNFSPVESTEAEVFRNGVNAFAFGPTHSLQASSLRNQGRVYLKKELRVQRWFSGAFTYYLPPSGTVEGDYLRAKKLFGGVTPETVWNLTPWSWAVDWFTNAGDVLSNISSIQQDGLVLKYGYIMEHSVMKHTYTYTGPTGYVGSAVPANIVLVSETKIRKKATPFGFGLNWSDFSPRQLSILTALGLTHRP